MTEIKSYSVFGDAYRGAFTALITPFANGKLDEAAFTRLVEWQIAEGIHGLVPCGTTGESPTLNYEEHNRVIELCVKAAKGRVPVMAGTGSNSTDEAILMTQHAQKIGADAALIVSPYYNKPTADGLYAHFKAIHDATNVPLFIYNIPGRSVINMSDELIAKLAELPRIAGLKDATGDLARPLHLATLMEKKHPAKSLEFIQLSGEDATAIAFNIQGGVGVISVASNIAPKLCASLQNAWFAGDITKAQEINSQLAALFQVMFCETSPAPVKYAAKLLGLCDGSLRLPMVPVGQESEQKIQEVLRELQLIR